MQEWHSQVLAVLVARAAQAVGTLSQASFGTLWTEVSLTWPSHSPAVETL